MAKKRKISLQPRKNERASRRTLDSEKTWKPESRCASIAATIAIIVLAASLAYRPLPNYDIYWMLAVGRRIVETRSYIFEDPFSFTAQGMPWSPQGYASAIVFFLLHRMGGNAALAILRITLVCSTIAILLRTLRSERISITAASPLFVVMLFNSHSRFTDRAQLFEYLLLAWLLSFLLRSRKSENRHSYLEPLAIQLLWVQFHSSFLLGPAIAAIFFFAEWAGNNMLPRATRERRNWKRAWITVLLMAIACPVNPNPRAFLIRPFEPRHLELVRRFTLEWISPFDPAVASGNFHPYYEILLFLMVFAAVLDLRNLPFGAAAISAATAFLSIKAHRFRVEFGILSAPAIAMMLSDFAKRKRLDSPPKVLTAICISAAIGLVFLERERIVQSHDAPELYPTAALDFISRENIAKRPFHTIGFGSYMMWHLYGKRSTFIDGRNFDLQLHRDFLAAQTDEEGLKFVQRKYKIDSFLIPAPKRSNTGMLNIHRMLSRNLEEWALVFADESAYVYVARDSVEPTWLIRHEIRIRRNME